MWEIAEALQNDDAANSAFRIGGNTEKRRSTVSQNGSWGQYIPLFCRGIVLNNVFKIRIIFRYELPNPNFCSRRLLE
jgi:hypothetical protein